MRRLTLLAIVIVFSPFVDSHAQTSPPGAREFGIARLKYGGGGDWYEDRTSLVNLLKGVRERTSIAIAGEREAIVEPGSAALYLAVNGILVQLPLPPQIDAKKVINAIDPGKDVDGFHPLNAGRLATGLPALVPCTPLGCIILAKSVVPSLAGLDAVVVGRSDIVGKPMAALLIAEATVTVAHSKTKDLPSVCRRADVLFAAVGRPEMIKGDWVRRVQR